MDRILCHRGRWMQEAGIEPAQNSNEAVKLAFLGGFGVELDIRATNDGAIVTGHDLPQDFVWQELFSDEKRGRIALHIKESNLASKLWNLLKEKPYLEYVIFGVPEEERQTYEGLFGKETLAFEFNAGDDLEKAINSRYKNIWLAETGEVFFTNKELALLKSMGKKLYLVMQDCHSGDSFIEAIRFYQFMQGKIDYICTDLPDFLLTYRKV